MLDFVQYPGISWHITSYIQLPSSQNLLKGKNCTVQPPAVFGRNVNVFLIALIVPLLNLKTNSSMAWSFSILQWLFKILEEITFYKLKTNMDVKKNTTYHESVSYSKNITCPHVVCHFCLFSPGYPIQSPSLVKSK